MLAVVEWHQIFEVIWASLVSSVLATALFAVVIHASSRSAEARRSGGGGVLQGAIAALALALFAAIVVFGITVILQKS